MKILITGSNGLLGQKIVAQCLKNGHDFLATSSGENRNSACPESIYVSMDITDESRVNEIFESHQPTAVIHTAAMTNVDACELDEKSCRKVNVEGTKFLFEASKRINAHFQLVSTDFIFDGKDGPYSEEDKPNPVSIYGQSKLDAESLLTSSSSSNWSISRTIIVFGTGEGLSRSNIILWAREALHKGGPLKIVNDQFRSPTWADDLAWGCLEIVRRKASGIFHLSGPKVYSIIELVKEVAKYYGLSTENISEVSSDTLAQPAKRPPITGFDLTKSKKILGYNPMSLSESLSRLEKELNQG